MKELEIIRQNDIVYGTCLGAGLLCDIVYPKVDKDMPVIISVHGGRWIRGNRTEDGLEGRPDNGVIDMEKWAKRGFFSVSIDYRLVSCTPAPACFQDVACAVRWIHGKADHYSLDVSNIFLIGQSAGGHMVTLAASLGFDGFKRSGGWDDKSHDFKAAISVSGAYNLLTLGWGSGWCPLGLSWDEARNYASPLTHVAKTDKDLMLFHAEFDKSVPIEQADEFSKALDRNGIDHVYYRYDKGGHLKVNDDVDRKSFEFITARLTK